MKTAIAPIVAVVAMGLGYAFHVTIDGNEQNIIVDALSALFLAGTAIWGIWKNHKKGE